MRETCERCGTPMVWSDHQLVCPRRGCAGMSTAAGFTLTDLRVDPLHVEATPWMGGRRRGGLVGPAASIPPAAGGRTARPNYTEPEEIVAMRTESRTAAPVKRDMLTPRENFTAWYGDELLPLMAGVDRLSPDHPIARRYPDRFKPSLVKPAPPSRSADGSSPLVRPASPMRRTSHATSGIAPPQPKAHTAAPGGDELPRPNWTLGLSPGLRSNGEVPSLLPTTSPVTVKLARYALEGICSITRATPNTHETGGVLVGVRTRGDATSTEITEARGPGSSAHLARSNLKLDWRVEHSLVKDRRLAGWDQITVGGCWHSHPVDPDDPSRTDAHEPSRTDILMWAAAWRHASEIVFPIDAYVGLIATEVGHAREPALTAWVLRRKPWAGLVVEPAAKLEVVG